MSVIVLYEKHFFFAICLSAISFNDVVIEIYMNDSYIYIRVICTHVQLVVNEYVTYISRICLFHEMDNVFINFAR